MIFDFLRHQAPLGKLNRIGRESKYNRDNEPTSPKTIKMGETGRMKLQVQKRYLASGYHV